MKQQQKLERFAERELKRNLHALIIPDDAGGIVAFGKYKITPQSTGFLVSTWDRDIHCFSSKRTAISWCSAENSNQYKLSNELLILDRKKQSLGADIQCRKGMGERGATEDFYETVITKIQPKIDQYTLVSNELEKCVISAKYLQLRGFSNETARTSGTIAK